MKRRSFLQSVIGFLCVPFLPKIKASNVIIGNGMDKVEDWNPLNYMDFSPDEIISIEKFHGRCLIFCKHSVWEIEENCYGDGLQRKLIKYI